MSCSKGLSSQVRNPVMELILILRDKVAPLAIEGMVNVEDGIEVVTEFKEVWGLKAISQEEGISPFLCTHFRPIYH